MPENWIALAVAFAAGAIIAMLLGAGRRGSGASAEAPPTVKAAAPAAPAEAGAENRRAISADMASLRRRLAMAEAALRDLRRGA